MLPLLITKVSTPGFEDERVYDLFSPFGLYGVLIMFLSVGPTDVRATSIAAVGLFTFPALMLIILLPFVFGEFITKGMLQDTKMWIPLSIVFPLSSIYRWAAFLPPSSPF